MGRTLVCIHYSPWSLKARWALDHHRVEYRRSEYLPMFGAPLVRLRARRFSGKLTIPLLIDGREVFTDSFDIAQRAEAIGSGSPLFAPGVEAVRRFNDLGERLSAAGRARATAMVLKDPAAQKASLPPALRALTPMARVGAHFLARKYSFDADAADRYEQEMAATLEALDAALTADFLLGDFSYADVAVAMALQFVSPADRGPKLGDARAAWTAPHLAERFSRLLEWRDGLLEGAPWSGGRAA